MNMRSGKPRCRPRRLRRAAVLGVLYSPLARWLHHQPGAAATASSSTMAICSARSGMGGTRAGRRCQKVGLGAAQFVRFLFTGRPSGRVSSPLTRRAATYLLPGLDESGGAAALVGMGRGHGGLERSNVKRCRFGCLWPRWGEVGDAHRLPTSQRFCDSRSRRPARASAG